MDNILITGACGQLGTELMEELRLIYGNKHIVASDIVDPKSEWQQEAVPFEYLDVLDKDSFAQIIDDYEITQVYHLAALLSAKAEQHPKFGWKLNTEGLLNVLDLAKEKSLKIYWPSSIAVFGPSSPANYTPQQTIMEPTTVYGISKLACERWCAYYFQVYDVDVRSLRYPGLIGSKALPGGGTTDYAVDIFYKALKGEPFECFLEEDTRLPMMYIKDAIKGTIELMQADPVKVRVRSSYNISAISFSPKELASSIQRFIPDFQITYKSDYRQSIADSWPNSIDDSVARDNWGWSHEYNLDYMTECMLENLSDYLEQRKLNKSAIS